MPSSLNLKQQLQQFINSPSFFIQNDPNILFQNYSLLSKKFISLRIFPYKTRSTLKYLKMKCGKKGRAIYFSAFHFLTLWMPIVMNPDEFRCSIFEYFISLWKSRKSLNWFLFSFTTWNFVFYIFFSLSINCWTSIQKQLKIFTFTIYRLKYPPYLSYFKDFHSK